MPSLKYEDIYKRALTMINDLELATYTEEDFYSILCNRVHWQPYLILIICVCKISVCVSPYSVGILLS